MECHDAQRIISEAIDKGLVSAEELEEAKQHAAGCTDCLSYIRTLTVLQKTPPPQPPDGLVFRVMQRVKEEAEAEAVRQALESSAAAAGAEAPAKPTSEPVDMKGLWARITAPDNRRTLAIWAGAAAVLLVFVGIFAISGVNSILRPGATGGARESLSAGSAGSNKGATIVPPPEDLDAQAPTTAETQGDAAGAGAPESYVSVDGYVYRLVGDSTFAESNLVKAGTIDSALDTDGPPQSFDYYTTPEKNQVVVVDASGKRLLFQLVVRDFAGNRYALRTDTIASFGDWPTMPQGQPVPATSDGSPDYVPAGTSEGISVYSQVGATPQAGIAVPPGTPATDPAAGNPNWTWWTP